MKRLLIVVDMQNDFANIAGSLYNPAAENIIPKIKERCEQAKKDGDPILFTRDIHSAEDGLTIEMKNIPAHCEIDTPGAEIVEELQGYVKEVFDKNRFCSTSIITPVNFLKRYDEFWDEVEICGTCTDICVISIALYLRSQLTTTKIVVDPELCAGTTQENHEAALKVMKSCLIDIKNDIPG